MAQEQQQRKGRFLLVKDVKSPMVMNGNPNRPPQINYKFFKKGKQVNGVLHMLDGKPNVVMVRGIFALPIEAVKEIAVKEVGASSSSFDGGKAKQKFEKAVKGGNATIKYGDALIVGALLGFGAVWLAEKKQWIKMPDVKNKYIGLAVGAGLAMYVVYRVRNK